MDIEYLLSLNEIERYNYFTFECERENLNRRYFEYDHFEDDSKRYKEEINAIMKKNHDEMEAEERALKIRNFRQLHLDEIYMRKVKAIHNMEKARQQYRDSVANENIIEAL